MGVKFKNNAATQLASGVDALATVITVADASVFPTIGGADYAYITLDSGGMSPTIEVVKATAVSGNDITIVRGQEGTTPASFSADSAVQLRLTAQLMTELLANGETAFGWGDHTGAGYAAASALANSANWDTAFSWGSHASAGYLTSETTHADVVVDGDFVSNGILKRTAAGTYGIVTDNSANWDAAFSWGNHASAGYAAASALANAANWDASFSWGNHASAGYQLAASAITTGNIASQSVSYASTAGSASTATSATTSLSLGGYSLDTETTILTGPSNGPVWKVRYDGTTANRYWDLGFQDGLLNFYSGLRGYNNADLTWLSNVIWHAGNDGAGSALDADLLDGYHASPTHAANTVVVRDGNGYIYGYYFNSSTGQETMAAQNYIFDQGDGWYRKKSLANVKVEIAGDRVPHQDGARYTTDFNSILTSGFYNAESTPANAPGAYGQLIVARGNDTGFQMYGGYNNDNLWFRGWHSSGATFMPWRKVWHDGHFADNSANWNAAYSWGNHASAGYVSSASPTFTGTTTVAAVNVTGQQKAGIVAMGALDVDCNLGNYFTKTIAGNSTFTFSSPPAGAYSFVLELTHTSGTVTWPVSVQ